MNTKPQDRLANFEYAAPEQKPSGNREVDRRADIYALGLMLNEMFTGEIRSGSGFKMIGDVSSEYACLDDLVDCMVQQQPENRPQTIGDVENYLTEKI